MKIKAEPHQNISVVKLLREALLTQEDFVAQINAALKKFGIEGTSGEDIFETCLDCAKSIELESDSWGDPDDCRGSEVFERYDQGKGNFSLSDASPELGVEFEVSVSGYVERDRGDYWTPPYSEDHISSCDEANLYLYYQAARDDNSERAYQLDGETIWEGEISRLLSAALTKKRK